MFFTIFVDTGTGFNETNSIRFELGKGAVIIPLGTNINWLKSESIYNVRLDIDQCSGPDITIKRINFYNYGYGE